MFIRKFLEPNKVDDVNALGHFIKVMNCEGVIRIRATFQGELVLESDARAGFDVQTKKPFDLIQITSDINQKLELWASEHKLSYDALSTKASRSNSFLVEHYGFGQQLVGYDAAQSRVSIVADVNWWVGGDGVNKYTGIPVAAKEKYIHDSAAPISAYIDIAPALKPIKNNERYEEYPIGNSQNAIRKINEHMIYFGGNNSYIYDAKTSEMKAFYIPPSQKIVGRMFMFENNPACILSKAGEVNQTMLGTIEDGTVRYSYLPIPPNFEVKGCDEKDGLVYLVGERTDGDNRSKIYTINIVDYDFTVTEFETNIEDGQPLTIDNIYINEEANSIWVTTFGKIYVGTQNLNDFNYVTSIDGLRDTDPCFSGEWAIFNAKGVDDFTNQSYAVHTEFGKMSGGDFLNSQPFNVTYIKDRLAVGYNANGVYTALGDDSDLEKVSAFNQDVNIVDLAVIVELNQKLYVFGVDHQGKRNALILGMEIDKEIVRAEFRAFKESF